MKKYIIKKDNQIISEHKTEIDALKNLKEIKLEENTITEALKTEGYEIEPFLEKEMDHAFRKDVYLLGEDAEGIKYWLEAPSWDCDWYWGFGYIETFQSNRKPSTARDIDSHSHAGNFHSKWWDNYNKEKAILKITTFTDKEGWELAELFSRFEILKDCAAMFGKGGAHISGTDEYMKKEEWAKEINEKLIPETTKRVIEILTPKK